MYVHVHCAMPRAKKDMQKANYEKKRENCACLSPYTVSLLLTRIGLTKFMEIFKHAEIGTHTLFCAIALSRGIQKSILIHKRKKTNRVLRTEKTKRIHARPRG